MADEIKFYRVNNPYGCFSNFSPHPVEIDNLVWPTTEHYFQAQKFQNDEISQKICRDASPMRAAEIGRSRKYKLREDWEQIKLDVMRKALRAKYTQHKDLFDILISTKDANLIEHTPHDNYWADAGDGSGKNMLGVLLMELRTQLNQENS